MKSHQGKCRAELESELKRLREVLEDMEETINFNFMRTSAHISGRQVRKDEDSLNALQSEIAQIQALLSKADGRQG